MVARTVIRSVVAGRIGPSAQACRDLSPGWPGRLGGGGNARSYAFRFWVFILHYPTLAAVVSDIMCDCEL
jgi:hypothetical protein